MYKTDNYPYSLIVTELFKQRNEQFNDLRNNSQTLRQRFRANASEACLLSYVVKYSSNTLQYSHNKKAKTSHITKKHDYATFTSDQNVLLHGDILAYHCCSIKTHTLSK